MQGAGDGDSYCDTCALRVGLFLDEEGGIFEEGQFYVEGAPGLRCSATFTDIAIKSMPGLPLSKRMCHCRVVLTSFSLQA